ncbi:MAG: hypothetical protein OEN20_07085 [Gammaproteobacteria bacterium]|nr:hypothetical protein [Gammaproteobacteria bacterium]
MRTGGCFLVFDYYHKLTPAQQAAYRESDAITYVVLQPSRNLHGRVHALREALQAGRGDTVARESRALLAALTQQLEVPRVRVQVLAVRPHDDWGELHGLYEPAQGRRLACVTLWMRTAKRRQVIAFRTFLRTLLHELCHHLDYLLYQFADSYHTQGFYQREASLFRQLVTPRVTRSKN